MFERQYSFFEEHSGLLGTLVYWLAAPFFVLLYVVGVREQKQQRKILWRHNVTGKTLVTTYVSNKLMSEYSSTYLENEIDE